VTGWLSSEKHKLCVRALYQVAAREESSSSQLIPVGSVNGLVTGLCEYGNELPASENSGNVFTGWVSVGFTMRTAAWRCSYTGLLIIVQRN